MQKPIRAVMERLSTCYDRKSTAFSRLCLDLTLVNSTALQQMPARKYGLHRNPAECACCSRQQPAATRELN